MKIKTQDLIGPPLDWAVQEALLKSLLQPELGLLVHRVGYGKPVETYSTTGDTVIEIMEREKIDVLWTNQVQATAVRPGKSFKAYGPTIRIAVYRCFVASKLGDEVDIPEELMP